MDHRREGINRQTQFLQQKQLQMGKQQSQKYPRKEAASLTWCRRQRQWHQIVMSPFQMYSKSNLTQIKPYSILGLCTSEQTMNHYSWKSLSACSHSAALVRSRCAGCSLKNLPASDSGCGACSREISSPECCTLVFSLAAETFSCTLEHQNV